VLDGNRSIEEFIGCRLRERRAVIGLSRKQLADKLQLDPAEIREYEKGTKRIPVDCLLRIARALNVPPDYFFPPLDEIEDGLGDPGKGRQQQFVRNPAIIDQGLRLHRAFLRIRNEAFREEVVNFIVELADSVRQY
jgi:transcriptional regulator with XRE-family HTH domain